MSEAYQHSRESVLKDFINASTPYERYAVFIKLLEWLDVKHELLRYREQDVKELKDQISALEEFKDKTFQAHPNLDLDIESLSKNES